MKEHPKKCVVGVVTLSSVVRKVTQFDIVMYS